MDPRDRLFGEIALRLQLLTREQLGRCVREQRGDGRNSRLWELAVAAGYISDEEAQLIANHQRRILEKRRVAQRRPQPPAVLIEERVAHKDPRSASGPAPPAAGAPRESGKSKSVNEKWATDVKQGAVPLVDAAAPGPSVPLPSSRPAAPGAAKPDGELDAFPLAQGDDLAEVGKLRPVPPRDQEPEADVPRGGTFLGLSPPVPPAHPVTVPPPAQPTPPLAPAAPGAAGGTIVQPFAPPPMAGSAPTSERPPKACSQRPRPLAADPAQSYLGRALAAAMEQGASDLHAHSGAPLMARVDGQLRALSSEVLNAQAAEGVIAEVMSDAQWAHLRRGGQVDFAHAIQGLGRFRVNVYRQQRGLDIVFRIIPPAPPALQELGLPARLSRLVDFRTGMVLCTGPAGCGKSTTLAALVNLLVQGRAEHVLTIENPVEYVYPAGRALVNQREVGRHTGSFARALRAALREDPDVIVLTELRDRETMALAISAAETGHLVLGTLHTGNAAQTINRIVSSFAADEQEQMRVMLSESLRAVVSQRLLPAAAGSGRIPAIELLMVNTAVSKLIRDDRTFQLPSVMQTGKAAGMITLDDSIAALVAANAVTQEVARRFADKKERFA